MLERPRRTPRRHRPPLLPTSILWPRPALPAPRPALTALAALLLAVSACADAPEPAPSRPQIEVVSEHPDDPLLIDFGGVLVGEAATQALVVRNVGTATLLLEALTVTGAASFALVDV